MSACSDRSRSPRARCSDCGKVRHLSAGVCDTCSADRDWCAVCQRWVDEWQPCKHVHWNAELGCLCGAGATHIEWDDHKTAVLDVFRAFATVSPTLLPTLRAALVAGTYRLHTSGDLFGASTLIVDLLAVPGPFHERYYQLDFVQLFGDDDPDTVARVHLGNAWLLSLEAGSTRTADARTVEWLDGVFPPVAGPAAIAA